ncbi:MAG: DUF305 domain-containing protein [Bacteroidota bacterium]
MKQLRLTLTLFVTLSGLCIFFASCQKDINGLSGKQQEISMMTAKSDSKNLDADKAYDKTVKEIMRDMMHDMNKMEMTCDPDIDFAMMMIMHHDAGIEMADAELQYGHDAEAKALAEKTKIGNQESKERLMAFLAAHPTPEPLSDAECKVFMKEMDETMHMMMQCMQKAPDTYDVDVDFANQMICHHQGAIDMSKVELKWGNDEPALNEAKMIIDEQSAEIIEFSQFLNEHGIILK